ncbi:hypothetical protein LOTGIDRAFT_166024 [Lottia gigantea]|uniref:Uncharacterized protein n=1 Tax=Lottia gigantea TaxID=225164 RepID=V3ZZB9_LOTGI|nr:hypothetical protein LOTGIDRAFT_166024 [Lottia gigantea]ESO88005.1 hypothetical protein LOTGIDRAFT_166024 [Lottia gigantea]
MLLNFRTVFHLCCAIYLHIVIVAGVVSSYHRGKPWTQTNQVYETGNRVKRWSNAAFHYVHNLNCDSIFFTTTKECRSLVSVPKSAMNIHVALPSAYGKYKTILPDDSLSRHQLHQAVMVVDPYPRANFGHLVIVFYIDIGVTSNMCQKSGGVYLENSECMTLALRKRCRNTMGRKSKRRNYARRCEINFLPVVHLQSNRDAKVYMAKRTNHLKCMSHVAGFGSCPTLRTVNETRKIICNPIRDNTQRCATTHQTVRTSCRLFEICDQAVLVSGGWNRHTTGLRHKQNIEHVYDFFRSNGFKRRNIKIFFANGAQSLIRRGDPPQRVYPAAMKLALRYHLRKLCLSSHCVDSLVLYLNSPAKNDGISLLWDINSDGLAEDNEKYPVSELKDDLRNCAAKNVHLIVDQSYSGIIAEAFHNSPEHSNIIVFTSGRSNEYSYDDEFTLHWTLYNQSRSCTRDIFEQSKNAVKHSTPQLGEGRLGQVKKTVFGAPCDTSPAYTNRELRHKYLGCQNLPTAVWLMKMLQRDDGIPGLNKKKLM